VAACAATALSPLYNWLLIFRLRWGLDGAVLALTAAELTMLVILAAWTLQNDRALASTPQQTWHGWCAGWPALVGMCGVML
jgi:Na+-driven multidrug efflux pump